jgi:hypothetical protein
VEFSLIFPRAAAGEINHQMALEKREGTAYYAHSHLTLFHHNEDDLCGFRHVPQLRDRQLWSPKKEIVQASGVPMVTM